MSKTYLIDTVHPYRWTIMVIMLLGFLALFSWHAIAGFFWAGGCVIFCMVVQRSGTRKLDELLGRDPS